MHFSFSLLGIKASTSFDHYLLILRSCLTNGIWYIACICQLAVAWLQWKLQPCHSQLTLYTRNIPNAICVAPPEDERVMLETCRGPWLSISWMKSASRWFHYTDTLWCTVSKTFSYGRLQDLILLFKIPLGTQKNFFEIYRHFGHVPS
jgi:hypothetical protein